MYQNLTAVGYLGRDPELRYLPSGTALATFSMATSEWRPGKDGQPGESFTTWFNVSVFGKQGESCNEKLRKGSLVMVVGSLRADERGNPRIWTRKDGTPGASFEITARQVKFLSGIETHSDDSETENEQEEMPF